MFASLRHTVVWHTSCGCDSLFSVGMGKLAGAWVPMLMNGAIPQLHHVLFCSVRFICNECYFLFIVCLLLCTVNGQEKHIPRKRRVLLGVEPCLLTAWNCLPLICVSSPNWFKYGTAFDPCSFILCCQFICCNGINTHARVSLLPHRFSCCSFMSRSFVAG